MKTAMLILAAGFSARMGVLKPLLPVAGEPAILRCIHTARKAGISDIFVVTGHSHAELEAVLQTGAPEVTVIYNEAYAEGMFSSVRGGIGAMPPDIDGFFILPADICAVKPETLSLVAAKFEENGFRELTYPVCGGKRGHPPLIPVRYISEILAYAGTGGLRGALDGCVKLTAETDDCGIHMDMDTPEDYSELLCYLGVRAYPNASECDALLEKYGTPERVREHGRRVAALGTALGRLAARRGAELNLELLESVCLVHDILRTEPNHAEEGFLLLLREGYPVAAGPVGAHMEPPDAPPSEIGVTELLYLADKLCRGDGIATISETVNELRIRFDSDREALTSALRRMSHAEAIMSILRERYGIGYEDFCP